jgi:polyisoprenoid-binding protein YceI
MPIARLRAWLQLSGLAFLLLCLVVPIPTIVLAQSAPAPRAFAIDGQRSSVRFVVHMRLRWRAEGSIDRVSGELRGDPAGGWTVQVLADGSSLKVAGPRWMERVTRSDDFLAVDSHPGIRFDSERFSDRLLRAGGRVRGQLTLRGLTRPVSLRLLPSACAHPGRDCDLRVNGIISRHAFGMTAHSATVKDDVELSLRVRLRAAAGTP